MFYRPSFSISRVTIFWIPFKILAGGMTRGDFWIRKQALSMLSP